MPFTDDLNKLTAFMKSQRAEGGGSDCFAEDVQGGFNQALTMVWTPESIKQAFHLFDAPGHGSDICDGDDSHRAGSPDGFKIQDQMKEFSDRGIEFTVIKVNNRCEKMIRVMESCYNINGRKLNITDLSDACAKKSSADITKDFVAATSFIMSRAVGNAFGATSGGKAAQKSEPLWDPKKFVHGQYLSQTAYLTVKSISGNTITVQNQFGGEMDVSKDILQKMDSATHFAKQVPMTMTELAELIETAGDAVFQVKFNKQPSEDSVMEKLKAVAHASLKDDKFASQLAKDVIEGNECAMVCHLVKSEGCLGRSTVIDLLTDSASKFRQVDHRSIIEITLRNVKYLLKSGGKKGSKADSDEEMDDGKKKKDEPKWDYADLQVGNTFSGVSYFKAVTDSGNLI